MENSRNTKPVEVIRMRGVSASIFANKVKDRPLPLYKVSLKRTYMKDGKFKSVTTFGIDDLTAVSNAVLQAWLRITELEAAAWKKKQAASDESSDELEIDDEE